MPPAVQLACPVFDYRVQVWSEAYRSTGTYRVRYFAGPAWHVLLLTELDAANTGPSVTNAAGEIVLHVTNQLGLQLAELKIIEHYDRRGARSWRTEGDPMIETFAQVLMTNREGERRTRRSVRWKWFPSSKQQVESWIGGALP